MQRHAPFERIGGFGPTSSTAIGKEIPDDRDGFGPETITTNPGVTNNTYVFKSHFYFKPSGAEDTNVSVRVIYANQSANVYCDYTKTITDFQNRAIEDVGTFGPALAELATSDAAAFGALGCIQPD